MYNTSTRNFTVADLSGSFDWIVEGLEPNQISNTGIADLVDNAIAQTMENDEREVRERAEVMSFPRTGYSTAHVYEGAEDYVSQKIREIATDLAEERSEIIDFIEKWRTGEK